MITEFFDTSFMYVYMYVTCLFIYLAQGPHRSPSFVGTKSTGVCYQTRARGTVCRRETMGRKNRAKRVYPTGHQSKTPRFCGETDLLPEGWKKNRPI